eukprot:m.112415 g.112415  ORF g.112415 m.112415 type:complete len:419 (-) comp51838_c0_seq2:123-1379(-)
MGLFRCSVCRVSCERHGHSTRAPHQAALQRLLANMTEKLAAARTHATSIAFLPIASATATFWCHFCEQEVPKHAQIDAQTVAFAAAIEHFGSEAHESSLRTFWQQQPIPEKFKLETFIFVESFIFAFRSALRKATDKILAAESEAHNSQAVRTTQAEQTSRRCLNPHVSVDESKSLAPAPAFRPRVTASAKGHGLTSLPAVSAGRDHVNIYSPNHVPPWLQPSEPSVHPSPSMVLRSPSRLIGPMLPQTQAADPPPPDFLPNFGGVWHDRSRKAFQRKFALLQRPVLTSANLVPVARPAPTVAQVPGQPADVHRNSEPAPMPTKSTPSLTAGLQTPTAASTQRIVVDSGVSIPPASETLGASSVHVVPPVAASASTETVSADLLPTPPLANAHTGLLDRKQRLLEEMRARKRKISEVA